MWDAAARRTSDGWVAEMAIPMVTLRSPDVPVQTWGINFARQVRRKNEQVYWSPLQRVYNITRLSAAGELRDLNVAAPRNFKLMPYALGQANRNFTPGAKTQRDATSIG